MTSCGFLRLGLIYRGFCSSSRRAAAVFLVLAFFQPKDAALVTAAALAASPVFQKLREKWADQS